MQSNITKEDFITMNNSLGNYISKLLLSVSVGLAICYSLSSLTMVSANTDVTINEANFPDPIFRTFVETYDTDQNGTLSYEEAGNGYIFEFSNCDLEDLTGIQYFYDLAMLSCSYTNLSSLDVSNMKSLSVLRISRNKIKTLNVSGATSLSRLFCSYNELSEIDLSGAPSLKVFSAIFNNLTSINITGLSKLTNVNLQKNNLTALDFQSAKNLEYLICSSNKLTSLNVQNLNKLKELNFFMNQLTTINLTGLDNLQSLNASYNQLKTIDVNALKLLSDLHVSSNQFQSLDIHGLEKITYLQLTCMPNLTKITLYDLPNLTEMQLFDNSSLEYVDLSPLTNLIYADCRQNNLKSIKWENPSNLETLYIGANAFTSLDFTGLDNLKELRCESNDLQELDLSYFDSLEVIWFAHNSLLALNIPSTTTYVSPFDLPQQYPVTIKTTDGTIDLSAYTTLDVSRIRNLEGATLSGNTLIVQEDLVDNLITYKYDIGNGTTNTLHSKIKVHHVKDLSTAQVTPLGNQTFTGKPLTPSDLTVLLEEQTLLYGTDYTLEYHNNIEVGTATVIIQGIGDYIGSISTTFEIIPPPVIITPSPIPTVKPTPVPTKTPTSTPSVTPTATPTSTIKPTARPTAKPTATPVSKTAISKATVSSISNKTYTGKLLKPTVSLKYKKGKLKLGRDYTVIYKNNKLPGRASIIIKGKGKFTGSKTITFNIVPKKVTSLKAKSTKTKTATVSWKKATGASGYHIVYSTKKTGRYKTVKTTSKNSVTITKLKKNKTYYVKVRAYKIIKEKKVYASYCSPKAVKVK